MKRNLAIITLLGAALSSAAVFADDCGSRAYIGGELQFNQYKFGNDVSNAFTLLGTKNPVKKSVAGGGIFVGSRFNEYVGIEAGFSKSGTQKGVWNVRTNNGNMTVKNSNIYLDALGYLPICDQIDLIGSVGIGALRSKVNFNVSNNFRNATGQVIGSSTRTGARVGAGVQYKFDENVGARLMARFQQANNSDVIKNQTQIGLGLFYQF